MEKRVRPTFTPLSAVRPRSVKTHREVGKRVSPTFTPLSVVRPRSQSHRRRLYRLTVDAMTWRSALGHKVTGAVSLTVGGHLSRAAHAPGPRISSVVSSPLLSLPADGSTPPVRRHALGRLHLVWYISRNLRADLRITGRPPLGTMHLRPAHALDPRMGHTCPSQAMGTWPSRPCHR